MRLFDDEVLEIPDTDNLRDAKAILGERYFQAGIRGRALRLKVRRAMRAIRAYDLLTRRGDAVPLWELDGWIRRQERARFPLRVHTVFQ